jgi:hypothetical protein
VTGFVSRERLDVIENCVRRPQNTAEVSDFQAQVDVVEVVRELFTQFPDLAHEVRRHVAHTCVRDEILASQQAHLLSAFA